MSSYRVTNVHTRQVDDMRDDYHPLDYDDFDPAIVPDEPFPREMSLDLVTIMRLLDSPDRYR